MNKFIITESEKRRILNMHNNYRNRHESWVIKEAFTGTAGDGYDGDVEACKKDLPFNVAVKTGQVSSSADWRKLRQEWGSDGSIEQNTKMRDDMCNGWRSGDSKESTTNTDIYTAEDRKKDEEKAWEDWGCITSKTKKVVNKKGGVTYHHEDGVFDLMGDYNDNGEFENDKIRFVPNDGKNVKFIKSCDDPIVVNLSVTNSNQNSKEQWIERQARTLTAITDKSRFEPFTKIPNYTEGDIVIDSKKYINVTPVDEKYFPNGDFLNWYTDKNLLSWRDEKKEDLKMYLENGNIISVTPPNIKPVVYKYLGTWK